MEKETDCARALENLAHAVSACNRLEWKLGEPEPYLLEAVREVLAATPAVTQEPPILHDVAEFLRRSEPKSCSCNDPEDGVQCWHHELQGKVTRVIVFGSPATRPETVDDGLCPHGKYICIKCSGITP